MAYGSVAVCHGFEGVVDGGGGAYDGIPFFVGVGDGWEVEDVGVELG